MDRLVQLPLLRLFVGSALFWLIVLYAFDNIASTTLVSTSPSMSHLAHQFVLLESFHHELIALAVGANLLFAASLKLVKLTPQSKITAGILLIGWQLTIFLRLFNSWLGISSSNWVHEVLLIGLWITFFILFCVRWYRNPQRHQYIWVYFLLIVGTGLLLFSDTALASVLKWRTTTEYASHYLLFLAVLSFLWCIPTTDGAARYKHMALFTYPSWRLIALSAIFLIFELMHSNPSIEAPLDLVDLIGSHWLDFFTIGFLYYLVPNIFLTQRMYSRALMESHVVLALVGCILIVLASYYMPINPYKSYLENNWEELVFGKDQQHIIKTYQIAFAMRYGGALVLTVGTVLLLLNIWLTIRTKTSKA